MSDVYRVEVLECVTGDVEYAHVHVSRADAEHAVAVLRHIVAEAFIVRMVDARTGKEVQP